MHKGQDQVNIVEVYQLKKGRLLMLQKSMPSLCLKYLVLSCWKKHPLPNQNAKWFVSNFNKNFIKSNLESISTLPAYCLHGVVVHLQDNKTSDLY